jgi:hypothetical protein
VVDIIQNGWSVRGRQENVFRTVLVAARNFSIAYLLVLLLLGLQSDRYYYVPSIIALPYIALVFGHRDRTAWKALSMWTKYAILILIVNSVLIAVTVASVTKSNNYYAQKFITQLGTNIRKLQMRNGKRVDIRVKELDAGSGVEIYENIAFYLQRAGISYAMYDFQHSDVIKNRVIYNAYRSRLPFGIYSSDSLIPEKKGDLIVITPSLNYEKRRIIFGSSKYMCIYSRSRSFGVFEYQGLFDSFYSVIFRNRKRENLFDVICKRHGDWSLLVRK